MLEIDHGHERFRTTFGQAGLGIAHCDLAGRWLEVNPVYCDLVGYSRDEMLGMTFQEITAPEDLETDVSRFERLKAGKIPGYSMTKRYVHKRGHLVWVDLTVTLGREPGDEPYAIAIVKAASRERRELIELEGRLTRAQRERDAFFELAGDLFVILDLRGGEPRFRRANPAMIRLLGYTEDELTSQPIYAFVHPEDRAYTRRLVELMQTTGLPDPSENRYLARDGRVVRLSWNMTFADGVYYCVARDVTMTRNRERRDAENQRRMAAESKLNALGRMAANISHEIKNPLSVIYGNACQLQKSLGESLPEASTRMLNDVQLMSMRIVKIIDGLRGFSREASRDPFETVPLAKILDDTLSFCEARFTMDHLVFQCQPVDEDIRVHCQPVQIQQVLLNLLNNAFDAATSGARAPKTMGIRHRADAERVWISVHDSGDGVAASARAHLFEPFFTTKQVGKGTGLGLSIARDIVTAHRGRLFLDETRADTTFVVELPRAYPSPPGRS